MSNHAILLLIVLFTFPLSPFSNPTSTTGTLTLASKLVHRYSSEYYHWISKNQTESNPTFDTWWNGNTSEQQRLLLQHDFTRQQTITSPHLLFPQQGSRTLFFGNDLAWLHYTWVDIGTPSISFLVALDTGSDLFWVPCDCIQCSSLSASTYTRSLDRDLSEYSPSLSNTSRHIPCGHQLCPSHLECDNLKEPCPYMVTYDDPGNTSSSGILIEDKLHLASMGGHSIERGVQASVIIGCGRKQSGSYLDGAAPDGLMGLGPGNISVPSLLAQAGLTKNSFSICFSENGSGRILFGDQGHDSQQSTPFLPIEGSYAAYMVSVESYCVGGSCLKGSGFKALVDTGSSFTYIPTDIYQKIVVEFDTQVSAKRVSSQGVVWEYCYNVSTKELHNVPSIRLSLFMNQSFEVHNPIYSVPQDQDYTTFCLTLQPTDGDYGIIGQNFMTGYNMVFDMEDLKLGWSASKCQHLKDGTDIDLASPANNGSSNPLPSDHQRSIPRTHAVAPAVAGRTPPNTSAAYQCFIFTSSLSLLILATLFLWVS